ncbi:23S rRNA (adenine(2030)-N(6))-methyltransferase RlmJ [Paralimibaculum aggregatum]|uniref:Ribosomal RNA large subunit methyltransferase J n=1 Tax=Paralimibaculum aggregatum TaxID=3036245 RepID=A0ABQ6LSK2_9RHOB|nr:23S rRNA (adenine(2030)-N(6))-methyltransferase RlmJ [Limibaculum sp. NKW23]GMG85058.1 23S rRNA (adenine(2030)-N(6))-methyltransferase RlmJ [Limibaculum sp. NKW23]
MLSYQHAYHAGNPADLHKHAALAALLALLTRKPRPVSYLESHAGRGLYDLDSAEARKTGEAAAGIGRAAPAGPYAAALAAVRAAHGPRAYPGSPAIARALLRPQDRLTLCELHPAEHAALGRALGGAGVAIHRRDGHEGLLALTPPKPRRGLALIDPSYEVKEEYAQAAETFLGVVARWPEGVAALWYPVLPAGRHRAMLARLRAALPGLTVAEMRLLAPPARGMQGAGLALAGTPHGTAAALAEAWAPFAGIFGPA